MAKTLIIATKFTAIDKFSKVVNKMSRGVNKMASKAEVGFARVQRAERKMRKGISKSVGMLGKLGLGFAALMIAQNILASNTKLDENLANLQAITGVSTEVFKGFAKEISNVSKKQKIFAGDTANAFTIVGSAQPELLKSAEGLASVTEAAMILSKASKDELTLSAQNLTGAMNQFNIGASESIRVINVLAAGSKEGAANITEINESLQKFGAVANASNVSLEQSTALIEVLAKKSIKGAEAGTMLRANIINLKKAGVGYKSGMFKIGDALKEVRAKTEKLTTAKARDAYMNKVFGKTGITAGQILVDNIKQFEDLTVAVTGTSVAIDQSNTNSNTLINRWNEVVNAFNNATTSTDSQNNSLQILKDVLVFVADNMETIVKVVAGLVAGFVAFKAIMVLTRLGLIAYNVALGITSALSTTASLAIGKSKIALAAYNVTSKLAAAGTWLFNAALTANPIGIIIVAIGLLIAGVTAIIIHWDTWGKTMVKYMGPLGTIIEMVMTLIGAWDGITEAFKSEGILAGLKKIGQTVIKMLIVPLKQAGEVLEAIGILDTGTMANLINSVGLGEETTATKGETKKLNSDAAVAKGITNTTTNKSTLDINNKTGFLAKLRGENPNINLTPSMGY